jgi:hypothetical protein
VLKTLSKTAQVLTYLGILPFFICAFLIVMDVEQQRAPFILKAYGACIVAFLSGTHWTIALKNERLTGPWLLLTSNIMTLLACASLLVSLTFLSLCLQFCALGLLLIIDLKLNTLGLMDPWFMRLRKRATCLVLIILFVVGVKFL